MLKVSAYEHWGAAGLDEFWENDANFRSGEFPGVDSLYAELRRRREASRPA